ncbi:MAG: TVP38/TMEM64 family protein [Desulfomonilia bacterium]|nr:TVP38/TMEM64 family protein [Desulfomonilia bacterium]
MKKKIALLIIIALTIGLFYYLDLGKYLTLENLKENRDLLQNYYSSHTLIFIVSYIVIYTVQTALSLPGAAILTLAGGAIFGAIMGTVWVNIGATTGAVLAFLLARTLLRDWVVKKFGRQMETLDKGLSESGMSYLLFLRLVPIFPFFLVNLACGITGLPLKTYILGTMVGILPGSFVYANAGASIASIDTMGDVASPRVLVSFALLGLFALIPTAYKKIKASRQSRTQTEPPA